MLLIVRLTQLGVVFAASFSVLASASIVVAAKPEVVRAAAEWVIAKQGSVEIGVGEKKRKSWIKEKAQIPEEHFAISRIDLSRTKTTDDELTRLAGLDELEGILFADCAISGRGLAQLAEFTKLRELSFYNGTVDDADLGRLSTLKNLRSLNLQRTRVTDESLKIIGRFSDLVDLNLEATGISDAGLKHLASLKKLQKLVLARTAVTDAGLAAIAEIKSLKQVMVHSCAVTDAGILQLAALPQLNHVSIRISRVTVAGRDALQVKLPQCKIEWEEGRVRTGAPAQPIADVASKGVTIKGKRPVLPVTPEGYFRAPVPKFLEGAVVYAPASGDLGNDPSLGVVDVVIEKKMGVFIAADWVEGEDERPPSAWMQERIPYKRFARQGWILIGGLRFVEPGIPQYLLFWKVCEAGETLRLRTQRLHPPIVIIGADPKLSPLSSVPSESTPLNLVDDVVESKLYAVLQRGGYAELEKVAATARSSGWRDRNGRTHLSLFYVGANARAETAEEWAADLAKLEGWLAAYPKSFAAHTALAKYWHDYGWRARGSGSAGSVTEEGAKLYRERVEKARTYVRKAYELTDQDPFLCMIDVELAVDFGDTPAEVEKIVRRSLKLDPDYTATLTTVADYYLPRWHGQPGDMEKWAERAVELTKERWGEALYAMVVRRAHDYHSDDVFDDFKFSWQRTKQGFADLRRRFPDSPNFAESSIRLAGLAGDRAEAQAGFAQLDRIRGRPGRPDEELERTWRAWSRDDFAAGEQQQTIEVLQKQVLRVEWTPDGKQWLALDDGESLSVFEAATGDLVGRKPIYSGDARFSALLPSGKQLVVAGWKGSLQKIDVPGGEARQVGRHVGIVDAALAEAGDEFATVGEDRKIKFWNVAESRDDPDEWDLAPLRAVAVAYVPKSRLLVVGGDDGRVEFWNRDTKEKSGELPKQAGRVWHATVSPDGELLAVQARSELTLWRIKSRERVAVLSIPKTGVSDLVFSRDGRYLAAGWDYEPAADKNIAVWNTIDGSLRHAFKGHKGRVRTLAFSPDGTKLVTGSFDRTIRVWKTE